MIMLHNIVVRSNLFFTIGLLIIAGSIGAAVLLQSFWPLIMIIVGVVMAFRLEPDLATVALADLRKQGALVHRCDKIFYGWINGQLIKAPYDQSNLIATKELFNTSAAESIKPDSMDDSSLCFHSEAIRVWPLLSIKSIDFTTDQNSFTIHWHGNDSKQVFERHQIRDRVLKFIKPLADWRVEKEYRTVFKLNFWAIGVGGLLIFFAMAAVITVVGIINPGQLPLANWDHLKNVQGKARGYFSIWIFLCEAYLFLVNLNLPVPLKAGLGLTISAAIGAIIYRLQWTQVVDATWYNPLHRGSRSQSP